MKAALSDAAVVWTINFLDLFWGDLAWDTNEKPQEPQEIECYKVEAAIEPQINTNVESFLLVFLFWLAALYQGIIDKRILSCSTDFFC